jgi:hypothetical protein
MPTKGTKNPKSTRQYESSTKTSGAGRSTSAKTTKRSAASTGKTRRTKLETKKK